MGDEPTLPLEEMSLEEAAEFWATHSVADYPSRVVAMDYHPEGRVILVPVESDIFTRLREQAKLRGVSVETLVNLWLQEKLSG